MTSFIHQMISLKNRYKIMFRQAVQTSGNACILKIDRNAMLHDNSRESTVEAISFLLLLYIRGGISLFFVRLKPTENRQKSYPNSFQLSILYTSAFRQLCVYFSPRLDGVSQKTYSDFYWKQSILMQAIVKILYKLNVLLQARIWN